MSNREIIYVILRKAIKKLWKLTKKSRDKTDSNTKKFKQMNHNYQPVIKTELFSINIRETTWRCFHHILKSLVQLPRMKFSHTLFSNHFLLKNLTLFWILCIIRYFSKTMRKLFFSLFLGWKIKTVSLIFIYSLSIAESILDIVFFSIHRVLFWRNFQLHGNKKISQNFFSHKLELFINRGYRISVYQNKFEI